MGKVIFTMAVGSTYFGNMAMNLSLSIKAQNPNQKVGLITDLRAIEGIEPLIEKFFDYHVTIHNSEYDTPHAFAFSIKPQLYDICTKACPDATAFIFIDADCIMLPKNNEGDKAYTDIWFEKHAGRPFTAYCNDMYNYATKTRKRKDYTFWCEPEDLRNYGFFNHEIDNKIPQINSSFLYFQKCDTAKRYFDFVKGYWDDDVVPFQKYKGAKPDEFCFNLASLFECLFPHQNTYRPIYFQCFSENYELPYIMQHYKAMGFAGQTKPLAHLVELYNQLSDWYRKSFAIVPKFHLTTLSKMEVDPAPIEIKAIARKTIYRRGELANSDAGVFNPSAIHLEPHRNLLTILRKQPNMECYKGVNSKHSAVAYVINEATGTEYELNPVGYDNNRIEDFRLFMCGKAVLCNHNIIHRDTRTEREFSVNLAYVDGNDLCNIGRPQLPIEISKQEKNWAFFGEGNRMWCIYSLAPYQIFYAESSDGWQQWYKHDVLPVEIDWWFKEGMICNSTNPVVINDYLLLFFHTKQSGGIYSHGAVLLDKTSKNILYYTHHELKIEFVNEGMQKDLLYVSGALIYYNDAHEPILRIYFGECDSNACYNDYDATVFIQKIIDSDNKLMHVRV